ncbi:MAG TPA: hypothetical protein VEC35_10970 [Noviherbaspirillum sp.]|nr:hypothetical protein [Noviherbaspirillum sp.]
MNIPTIEEIKALDGRIFATLSEKEQAVLDFYRDQGRKFGVSVSIVNEADSDELAAAKSVEQADQILKRTNSRVRIRLEKPQLAATVPGNTQTDDVESLLRLLNTGHPGSIGDR